MADNQFIQGELFQEDFIPLSAKQMLYRERVQKGLCPSCGKPATGEFKRCDECLAKARESSSRATAEKRTIYHRRRQRGECGRCGAPSKSALCPPCAEYVRSSKVETTAERRSRLGLCPGCGKQPDEDKKSCSECRRKQRESGKDQEEKRRRREQGLCCSCGKKIDDDRCRCQRCHTKAMARKRYYRQKALREGLCQQCKKVPVSEKKTCEGCLEKIRIKVAEKRANGICLHCSRKAREGKKLCGKCSERMARIRRRRKDRVFAAYGGYCCRCCGETRREFLQIDHVNNDGYQHRKRIGKASLYNWLIKNNFPPGFQVLCSSCNFAKGHFGECPHVRELCNLLSVTSKIPLLY